jgi:hypothetical protein
MEDRPKRRLEFYIAKDQFSSLRELEKKTGSSIAGLIREAIDEFLAKRSAAKGAKQNDDARRNG